MSRIAFNSENDRRYCCAIILAAHPTITDKQIVDSWTAAKKLSSTDLLAKANAAAEKIELDILARVKILRTNQNFPTEEGFYALPINIAQFDTIQKSIASDWGDRSMALRVANGDFFTKVVNILGHMK